MILLKTLHAVHLGLQMLCAFSVFVKIKGEFNIKLKGSLVLGQLSVLTIAEIYTEYF